MRNGEIGVIGVERISGETPSVGVVDSDELELRPTEKRVSYPSTTKIGKKIFTGVGVNVDKKILWNGRTYG